MCVYMYIMQTCVYAFLEDSPVHTSPSQSVFYFMSVHGKVKLDQHISLSCVCVCMHMFGSAEGQGACVHVYSGLRKTTTQRQLLFFFLYIQDLFYFLDCVSLNC